jgi:predicted transcriptional regulator
MKSKTARKKSAEIVSRPGVPSDVRKPDEMLNFVCEFFGIDPEKDKLAYEIFKEVIEARKDNHGVRTIEVTKRVHVTQAAVVYHMNTFVRNGIVIKQGREYVLRGENLDRTFEELELDMLRRMKKMRELAKRIDESMFEF